MKHESNQTGLFLQRLILFSALGMLSACQKDTSREAVPYTLKLVFSLTANGEPLRFNREYLNRNGEDFRVTTFKFYVGRIGLQDDFPQPHGQDTVAYFLIDAADATTHSAEVKLNGRSFNKIVFQIGIDSVYHVSGAQTGALDPMKGMFWTWNTGYINAKLEGRSSFSRGLNQAFTYHIGGFRQGQQTQRTVVLPLPAQQEWSLQKTGVTEAVVTVDLDKWFRSVHQLPIAAVSEMMVPGPVAVQYADNYATLFSIASIRFQ